MTCAPRDPGLQPERTSLAWRRTALAIATAAIVSVRLLPPVLGPWSLLVGVVGAAGAFAMLRWDRARWARASDAEGARANGAPLFAVAMLMLGLTLAGLGLVLAR